MDELEHPALGLLKLHYEMGWIGRSDPGPDFFDLVIMFPSSVDAFDDPPLPTAEAFAALEHLMRDIDAIKATAVNAVCAAREARLNWRAGPVVEAWSIVEARIDREGALWLGLHEYETDEYSRWLVRLSGRQPIQVRRTAALEMRGDPSEEGLLV
ncbi:hypothetical protein U91I_00887 [alpha proteobacterium U9-1i]|nr:hypothetical protein U91I_00887 [alpha proteobacterium U9-1i]